MDVAICLKLRAHSRPVPHQQENRSQKDILMKFQKTLEFMKYNQAEQVLLQRFEAKFNKEAYLNKGFLSLLLQSLGNNPQLKRQLQSLARCEQSTFEAILFKVNNLARTASQQTRILCKLLQFYAYLQLHITEYRLILMQFESRSIHQALSSFTLPYSQILKSLLLTCILLIYLKFGQDGKANQLIQETCVLRQAVQVNYDYQLETDFYNTTLYFNLKHIQLLIKSCKNDTDLLKLIQMKTKVEHTVIELAKEGKIAQDSSQIAVEHIGRLKQKIAEKSREVYLNHQEKYSRKYSQSSEPTATKSLSLLTKMSFFKDERSKSVAESQGLPIAGQKTSKIKVTPMKKIYADIQTAPGRFLRPALPKSKKVGKVANNSLRRDFSKIIKRFAEGPPTKYNSPRAYEPREETISAKNMDLLINYGQISSIINPDKGLAATCQKFAIQQQFYRQKQAAALVKDVTRFSIQTHNSPKTFLSYEVFANKNRILLDLNYRQLQREMKEAQTVQFFDRKKARQIFSTRLINFEIGLSKAMPDNSRMKNQNSCLSLQFVKLWLHQLSVCTVKVELEDTEFILSFKINRKVMKIILATGDNVLCEKYNTVWPTLRYLIYKKILQVPILKDYAKEFLFWKSPEVCQEASLETYQVFFGSVDEKEIQEIDVCLDNLFKFVSVLQAYCRGPWDNLTVTQKNQPAYLLFPLDNFKQFLLSEMYLSQRQLITLARFTVSHDYHLYAISITLSCKQAALLLNHGVAPTVELSFTDIESFQRSQSLFISVNWPDLEKELLHYLSFVRFVQNILQESRQLKSFSQKIIKFYCDRIAFKYQSAKKNLIETKKPCFNLFRAFLFDFNCQTAEIFEENYARKQAGKITPLQNFSFPLSKPQDQLTSTQFDSVEVQSVCRSHTSKLLHSNISRNASFQRKSLQNYLKINQRSYLVMVNVWTQKVSSNWLAEYCLIEKGTQRYDKLAITHLDYLLLSTKQSQNSVSCAMSLLDKVKFCYDFGRRKPYLIKEKKKYRCRPKVFDLTSEGFRQSFTFRSLKEFAWAERVIGKKVFRTTKGYILARLLERDIEKDSDLELQIDYPRQHFHYVCVLNRTQITNFSKRIILKSSTPILLTPNYRPNSREVKVPTIDLANTLTYMKVMFTLKETPQCLILNNKSYPFRERYPLDHDREGNLLSAYVEDSRIEISSKGKKVERVLFKSNIEQAFKLFFLEKAETTEQMPNLKDVLQFSLKHYTKMHQE